MVSLLLHHLIDILWCFEYVQQVHWLDHQLRSMKQTVWIAVAETGSVGVIINVMRDMWFKCVPINVNIYLNLTKIVLFG